MELELHSQPLTQPLAHDCLTQEICHDWHGEPLSPPAQYRLLQDPTHLWFIAGREETIKPGNSGVCGDFIEGLWRYDVAELFIAGPNSKNYLEFNLAPNGAWWAARFSAPRRSEPLGELPQVVCDARQEQGWLAALGLPLNWLRPNIAWSANSPLNVCFILDSPEQRFISACDLGTGEPDFHRPARFQALS